MTNMAETSLFAFRSFSPDELQAKEREVLGVFLVAAALGDKLELTREQIADYLHWKESAVCGRVNSLVKKGHLAEKVGGRTHSGRPAMLVHLPEFTQ
jgi:DNA-binding MarR family transcriptional regulator